MDNTKNNPPGTYTCHACDGKGVRYKCVICGSDEPGGGTCGSDDPRALCKALAQAPAASAASITHDPKFRALVLRYRNDDDTISNWLAEQQPVAWGCKLDLAFAPMEVPDLEWGAVCNWHADYEPFPLYAAPVAATPAAPVATSEHPDTKRLDWMIFQQAYFGHGSNNGLCRVWRIECGEEFVLTDWHTEPREAIDAAMSAAAPAAPDEG